MPLHGRYRSAIQALSSILAIANAAGFQMADEATASAQRQREFRRRWRAAGDSFASLAAVFSLRIGAMGSFVLTSARNVTTANEKPPG